MAARQPAERRTCRFARFAGAAVMEMEEGGVPRSPAPLWRRLLSNPRWWASAGGGAPKLLFTVERGVLLLAIGTFVAGLIASVAALFGHFRLVAPILWAAALACLAAVAVAAANKRVTVRGDAWDLAALGIVAVAALSAGFLHHDDFIGTFDTAFYLEDAIIIAETGGRTLDGGTFGNKLVGFGGNVADGYKANALFGYGSLTALFVYAAGWQAAWWVNALLTTITGLSLYAIARRLGARSGALLAVGLYHLSLITFWFNRWTMSENAATAVFWAAVLLALPLVRKPDPYRIIGLMIALAYGMVVRPEGVFIALYFGVALAVANRRRLRDWAKRMWSTRKPTGLRSRPVMAGMLVLVVVAAITLAVVVVQDRARQIAFVVSLLPGLLRGRPLPDAPDVPVTGPSPNWGDYAMRYQLDSAMDYWLPVLLGLGILGAVFQVIRRREALWVLAFCGAYTVFLFMPPVTIYHPWFFRRLWIAWIPLAYLLGGATLDVHRLGFRWPVKLSERAKEKPRPSALAMGGVVAVAFLLLHVDVGAPFFFAHEEDQIGMAAADISEGLPDGALILVDQQVAQYSGALRVVEDHPVVVWFPRPHLSLYESVVADEQSDATFILRSPSQQVPGIAAEGEQLVDRFRYDWQWIRRDDLSYRQYIRNAPLEQGYKPLEFYLTTEAPPEGLQEFPLHLELVEVPKPLIIQRRVAFESEDWTRTDFGAEAAVDSARILLDPTYSLENRSTDLSFYTVHQEVEGNQGDVFARTNSNTTIPLGAIESDGSSRFTMTRMDFADPGNVTGIEVSQGVMLRGIYLGSTAGLSALSQYHTD